jgi:hypothetical protein
MREVATCRGDVVLELFAHDREALAWVVAEADRELVRLVHAAAELADASRWPAQSRLVMAAIEIVEGRRPAHVTARSRSPVLEMPADLRDLAERADLRLPDVGGGPET